MKEFVTAVEDIEQEDRPTFLLDEAGKVKTDDDGNPIPAAGVIPFKMDGRTLYAHPLEEGQLAFMLASMGRGQTSDGRFASIINIMLASLRGEDQDYLEGRLLSSGKDRIGIKTIEGIFEFLTEEWFATPTQEPSDSAPSLPSGGQN